MNIFNLEDKIDFLDEVAELEYNEWANNPECNSEERLKNKKEKIKSLLSTQSFCKLVLLKDDTLIGFISIFPNDCEEEKDLSPWYSTMYVKKEFRGKGYSKILNDAILKEAYKRDYKLLYLKTDLNNYYEKFGAEFIKVLKTGERLYKINTTK